jgi:hypothetical protein
MNIQLKVTKENKFNMYSFRGIKNTYKDMLLFCICISECKIWIIPFNELEIKIFDIRKEKDIMQINFEELIKENPLLAEGVLALNLR